MKLSAMIQSEASPMTGSAIDRYGSAQWPNRGSADTNISADQALFFRAWLRQPAIIGAVMPTRAPLARAIARAAAATGCNSVLELGGGTGPITQALVNTGVAPQHLTIVERNPVFYRLLTRRFPSLRIICGDAENLSNILGVDDMGRLGAVVSSLPRIGWPLARQRSILEQCFALLRTDGVFLEFSYGPFSPVPMKLVNELDLVARRLPRVWSNFPPASVWGYRRVRVER